MQSTFIEAGHAHRLNTDTDLGAGGGGPAPKWLTNDLFVLRLHIAIVTWVIRYSQLLGWKERIIYMFRFIRHTGLCTHTDTPFLK